MGVRGGLAPMVNAGWTGVFGVLVKPYEVC
jgi:hypothetical protein